MKKAFLISVFILTIACFYAGMSDQRFEVEQDKTNIQLKELNKNEDKTLNAKQPTEQKYMEELNLTGVTLQAKAEQSESQLTVEYEVENHSKQVIYLWDRMVGYNEDGQIIDPDIAYIFFDEPKTVDIIRADLPPPQKIRVASKEIPFVRTIDARSKVAGKIVLALPLVEFSPYYPPAEEENMETRHCSMIRLLLGWSEFRDGMQIREQTIGDEKVLAIRGVWAKPYYKILEKQIPMEVDIKIYKSDFERQKPLQ